MATDGEAVIVPRIETDTYLLRTKPEAPATASTGLFEIVYQQSLSISGGQTIELLSPNAGSNPSQPTARAIDMAFYFKIEFDVFVGTAAGPRLIDSAEFLYDGTNIVSPPGGKPLNTQITPDVDTLSGGVTYTIAYTASGSQLGVTCSRVGNQGGGQAVSTKLRVKGYVS